VQPWLKQQFMKRVFTSAGILALGATALYAYDPEMTRQVSGRPWTVAASVRGFYDDNVATSHDHEEESFGLELSPSVHLNLPFEQTFVALGYIYTLRWYENRDPHEIDQAHQFNAKLQHQFSPRHSINVDESFLLTSEPTVAEQDGIITSPIRSDGDILHNRGAIDYNVILTRRTALGLGYENNWYDYEQEGGGSRSALLDRLDHLIRADGRYQFNPNLVGILGYSFAFSTYTGDDFLLSDAQRSVLINAPPPGMSPAAIQRSLRLMSDDRDSHTHYGYVGADYDLTARLRATARVGGQFTSYTELDESTVSPYADASLSYTYMTGSAVSVGVRHDRSATDIVAPDSSGQPTLDAQATAVYAQVVHRITSKLTGSAIGQFQTMTFNDGVSDGSTEELYLVGLNLAYQINRHFSTEVGYNHDFLSSDVPGRSYHRNRVYVGVRATY
jgi:hypothetical protein